ncbi:hypothetical protein HGM15179_018964 [Zosterops borbonicus]|uniref:Reverse transcriptase thumb domain-containing protein n=1 Tax=Zosterops borbonicus TaxID=364589 RepID=A0A8K1DAJ0_9PASS|nr:hypothetical protein HGM15179_018964 [Zosterops borbonicus]
MQLCEYTYKAETVSELTLFLLARGTGINSRSIEGAGFEIATEKIQHTCPWTYLGLWIGEWTISPQLLTIKDNPRTLRDLHQLCGIINWMRNLIGITTEDLAPLFNLLIGPDDLNSPQTITPEAREVIQKCVNVDPTAMGGHAPSTRADSSASRDEDHGEAAVSLQAKEGHRDAEIHWHAAHEEPHARVGGCLEEAVSPWETHGERGPAPILEQPVLGGLHPVEE